MDWTGVVEKNQERLRRILAMLFAMAGLAISQSPPLRGRCPAGQRGVSGATVHHPPLSVSPTSPPQGGRSEHFLPRHLHRAILRLLRPAESAARRLILVAARDIVVELPPSRPRKPKPDLKAAHAALRRLGIAVVLSSADIARAAAERRAAEKRAAARRGRSTRPFPLPLVDPLRRFGARRKYVPAHAAPRILSFDGAVPHRLPPPPAPHDPIDATRLGLRLAALAAALDDLPGQAKRFARWKALSDRSRAQGRIRRISPLKPGRAPGLRVRRRSEHDVHEVLRDLQYFACEALKPPDTS